MTGSKIHNCDFQYNFENDSLRDLQLKKGQ